MRSELSARWIRFGNRWLAPVLLLIAAAGSLRAGLTILMIPGDFSINRIVLLAIPIIVGFASLIFCVYWLKNRPQKINTNVNLLLNSRQKQILEILIVSLWLVLYILAFLPDDLGRWTAVYVRLNPILQLSFLLTSEAWFFWLFTSRQSTSDDYTVDRPSIYAGLILAVTIIVIVLIIVLTGLGIGVGTQFWGKTGVPILHWQLWVAGGFVVIWIQTRKWLKKPANPKLTDFLAFILLWGLAFTIWQSIPLAASRYSTTLYPPNYVSYPYSDAGDYAIQAEGILLGSGFPYGFIDKPLHLVFLAFLGLLAGKDFALQTTLQVAFLAINPALVYLLTSKISSRPAGLCAGIVFLFMQANNLALTNRIQMTNVKMAMSEPLTSFMLLLFGLALASWWKNPKGTRGYPALAGAVLGLSALVRLNALVIAPFVILAWLMLYGIKDSKVWIPAFVFIGFCVVPLVPWSIRTQIVLHNPIEFIKSKTEGVLLKQRYNPIVDENDGPQTEPANQPTGDSQPTPKPVGYQGLVEPMLHSGFHNLVSVALVLPASSRHTGLDDTVRQAYWDQEWDGTFTAGGVFIFVFSLMLVVVGFSRGWYVSRGTTLIPLLILIPYLMANTASLVSGGRYIVPVDWVLPLYYCIGLTAFISWILQYNPEENKRKNEIGYGNTSSMPMNPWVWIALGLVIIVSFIPMVLSLSIPRHFRSVTSVQVLNEIRSMNISLPENLTWSEVEAFSQQKDAQLKIGRAMFPRWMKSGLGDTAGAGSAFSALPFDHLSFSMLSDTVYPFPVVLPINRSIDYFPNATDVYLVGCKNKAYFDAVMVILRTPTPIVFTRPDISTFSCPLPIP